jgi:hypothetical protein
LAFNLYSRAAQQPPELFDVGVLELDADIDPPALEDDVALPAPDVSIVTHGLDGGIVRGPIGVTLKLLRTGAGLTPPPVSSVEPNGIPGLATGSPGEDGAVTPPPTVVLPADAPPLAHAPNPPPS